MKLILNEPELLKNSISIISDLVSEAKFIITPTGMEIVAMDDASVAMVIFKLPNTSFAEYSIEKDTEIGLNLVNLKQILRRATDDALTIELEENRLKLQLQGRTTKTFNLPVFELEGTAQKVPDLKFSASVKTTTSILTNAVGDADIAAEAVAFIAKPQKFILEAEGDLNRAVIEIPEDDTTKVDAADEVKSKYSLEYLKKMITGSKISDQVLISFSKDYPLRLDFGNDKLSLSFILAPRIEDS